MGCGASHNAPTVDAKPVSVAAATAANTMAMTAPAPSAAPASDAPLGLMMALDAAAASMDITDCWDAARADDVDKLRAAHAAGVDLTKLAGLHSATILHGAASAGAEAAISYLIGESILAVNVTDQVSQGTPLMSAAASHQEAAARLLLSHGASVDATDLLQDTALHKAVKAGAADVATLLLAQGAEPEAPNEDGKSSLVLAQELLEEDEELGRAMLQVFIAYQTS